jgi:hypothetical protein
MVHLMLPFCQFVSMCSKLEKIFVQWIKDEELEFAVMTILQKITAITIRSGTKRTKIFPLYFL